MKLLLIMPIYEPARIYGGPVVTVGLMCKELIKQGIDVTVYTTNANGDHTLPENINTPILMDGVKIYRFPILFKSNYFFSLKFILHFWQTINQFDLIHIISIWNFPGIPATWFARLCKKPYIVAPHGSLIPESYPGLRLKKFKKITYFKTLIQTGIEHANAVHYTAKQEFEESRYYLPNYRPSFIIPNGIDCSEFDNLPGRDEGLKFFQLPKDARNVTYLGRLHSGKALDILIKSFAQIAEEFPDVYLILAGPDGGFEATLRELSAQFNLVKRVRFTGMLNSEERKLLFACSNIATLVSHGENFGVAIVEAMAAGIPVIVSKKVCIHHDITKAGAGYAVDVGEDSLANALKQMLQSPIMTTKMGQVAAQTARNYYDIEKVTKSMANVYQKILNGETIGKDSPAFY
jgi:glycosyltransferase involved in cell wall biosynthesis